MQTHRGTRRWRRRWTLARQLEEAGVQGEQLTMPPKPAEAVALQRRLQVPRLTSSKAASSTASSWV
jgi:hypothetical protein